MLFIIILQNWVFLAFLLFPCSNLSKIISFSEFAVFLFFIFPYFSLPLFLLSLSFSLPPLLCRREQNICVFWQRFLQRKNEFCFHPAKKQQPFSDTTKTVICWNDSKIKLVLSIVHSPGISSSLHINIVSNCQKVNGRERRNPEHCCGARRYGAVGF